MKFTVITHVHHIKKGNTFFAYGPYVKEINLWAKHFAEIQIVAPLEMNYPNAIDLSYKHNSIQFKPIKSFNAIGVLNKCKALFSVPKVAYTIFKAMKNADHIHLRCPGNVGLIGCFVQIFFPHKKKTAKYAGNWDSNAKQPFSYKIQKWILSNTFLTKNMTVLVYGEWKNQTKNIKSFFTATYFEDEKETVQKRILNETIKFIFVGTLSLGKRPMYALKLVHELIKSGYDVQFDIFGEGSESKNVKSYIAKESLENKVKLHGNQNADTVKEAYQNSHFLILSSQSEGWPKALAEAMFWGCVPIATSVSCVKHMLDNEKRGVLLNLDIKSDSEKIQALFNSSEDYQNKSDLAQKWSRKFTMDYFEEEIKKLLL